MSVLNKVLKLSHGGVEKGQGIHTKMIQVKYTLQNVVTSNKTHECQMTWIREVIN